MPEDFLHFIWRFQLFDHLSLRSVNEEKIQVLSAGYPNHNSGPDFLEARLLIDDRQWIGNVEIHVNTSDWFKHNHQFDPSYNNVILHVVYSHDDPMWDYKTNGIPIIELKSRIEFSRFKAWEKMQRSETWIPCQNGIQDVPIPVIFQMIHRCSIDRVERKVNDFNSILDESKGHWERALMQCILTALGGKVNGEAARILARLLPFEIVKKNLHNELLISALVFGIAGLLKDTYKDHYPSLLAKEFNFLRHKYSLHTMDKEVWKFMRMRPANFPSIRLAQFVVILCNWEAIVTSIVYKNDLKKAASLMRTSIHTYWEDHYRFDHHSKVRSTKLGKSMFEVILINAVVPFLYSYGKKHGNEKDQSRALSILEGLSSESNGIISAWRKLGIEASNSLESQGLIELKNTFCTMKKCLSCKIGVWIINP